MNKNEREPVYNMFEYQNDILQRGEDERKRQEAVAYRMGQIMMQEYWKHFNEEKYAFWDWFNNERLNEED